MNTNKPDKKPEAPRCGTCHFMSGAELCHRYPKQVVSLGAFTSCSAQPKVNPLLDWCGEHKLKQSNGSQ